MLPLLQGEENLKFLGSQTLLLDLFTKQFVLYKGLLPAEEREEKFFLVNLIS